MGKQNSPLNSCFGAAVFVFLICAVLFIFVPLRFEENLKPITVISYSDVSRNIINQLANEIPLTDTDSETTTQSTTKTTTKTTTQSTTKTTPKFKQQTSTTQAETKNSNTEAKLRPLRVHVLSAFYSPKDPSVVTVVIVHDEDAKKENDYEFQCEFLNAWQELVATTTGRFYIRRQFKTYIHCDLPLEKSVPETVQLSEKNTTPPTEKVALKIANNHEKFKNRGNKFEYEMGACIGRLYGTPNWMLLVAFMEHMRYQISDVSKVFFSTMNGKGLQPALRETSAGYLVLKYYREKFNMVEITHYNCTDCRNTYDNVCLLNGQYRFRYLMYCDYDEILLPVKPDISLQTLISKIAHKHPKNTYGFRIQYRITPEQDNQKLYWDWADASRLSVENTTEFNRIFEKKIPLLSWNSIAQNFASPSFSPKMIVRPELIKLIWVHSPIETYEGGTYTLDPDKEGFFWHYKNTTLWGKGYTDQTKSFANYAVRHREWIKNDHPYLQILLQRTRETIGEIAKFGNEIKFPYKFEDVVVFI